jgi:O-antigen/teichoic acid export membrane protein
VVVIAFPSMARRDAGRDMHLVRLGVVLAIGAVTVAGVASLSELAVTFVGGPEYAGLQGRLWVFAALGTLLALLQLLIYNIVARQRQRAVLLVWAALAVLTLASPFVSSVTLLLSVVVGVDGVLFVLLLARSLTPSYSGHAAHPDVAAAER